MRPADWWVVAVTVLATLAPCAAARAGEGAWSVRVWQADGLPDRHINGLAQTDDGFLWVATSEHVARFDGIRFEASPTRSLAPRAIRAFLQGRRGLWLTTNRGPLLRLEPGRAPQRIDGLPELSADVMVEDHDGAVWIGYHDGAVARVRGGQATVFDETTGLGRGSCWLARDTRGRIWYAQGLQVGVYENGAFRPLTRVPYSSTRVTSARAGGVWIGSGPQLFRYDAGGVLEPMGTLPSTNPEARMSVLLETKDGALWIGTRHDGLFRRTEAGVESVPSSHTAIRCLMEDREGDLWVGTGGGGLNRVAPRVLEVEGASTGLSSKLIQSVTADSHGTLWGATRHGRLVQRVDGEWREVALDGLGAANGVAAGRDGAVWIGTRSRRLHRLQDGRLATWSQANGLEMRSICSLLVSRSGDVWIAGEAPGERNVLRAIVQRVRGETLQTIALPAGTRRALALAEDASGTVWIGAVRGRLLRVHGDAAVEQPGASNVVQKQIRSLHATADGSLFVGYDEGGGLGRWKDGAFTHVGSDGGLPGSTVAQIVEDAARSLWLGTDGGLFKLDPEDLDAVLERRAPQVRPIEVRADETSFHVSAGECGWTSAVLARNGALWMPMGTALLIAHPTRLAREASPPPVRLTRVLVDGRARAAYRGVLPPPENEPHLADLGRTPALSMLAGERRLEIEFTAPAFRSPEKVRFRHRLDGVDETWVDAGTQRVARYPRLPPGEYRFHVSACGPQGTCDDAAGASLGIAVPPLFWQTWWFRLLALSAFTGALAAAVRYVSFRRLRRSLAVLEQQAALDRERTRIARDIHDDVGNRLNRITLLSELALRNDGEPAQMESHVRDISAGVREVISALDEVVWTVSPRHDTLPHLVSRLGQFTVEYLRAAGVRCELDLPPQPPDWPVSAELRHHVFCAVKEALTNAVRHGRPRAVTLAVAVAADSFTVVVQDDGTGFAGTPSSSDPGADGLRNMQQRLAEVGGRLELASTPGAGTRVSLWVPWPRRPAAREPRS